MGRTLRTTTDDSIPPGTRSHDRHRHTAATGADTRGDEPEFASRLACNGFEIIAYAASAMLLSWRPASYLTLRESEDDVIETIHLGDMRSSSSSEIHFGGSAWLVGNVEAAGENVSGISIL
jgi:hypothetical protein